MKKTSILSLSLPWAILFALPLSATETSLALHVGSAETDRAQPLQGQGTEPLLLRSCDGETTTAPHPIVGAAGESVPLRVEWSSCSDSEELSAAPDANLVCRAEIDPRILDDDSCRTTQSASPTSQEMRFSGSQSQQSLEIPAQAGAYDLRIQCESDGRTLPSIEATLYAPWHPSLDWILPAEEYWYELGACWTQGFDDQAEEDVVLRAVMDGIYAYGRENFRYGYANLQGDFNPEGSNTLHFPISVDSADDLVYTIEDPNLLYDNGGSIYNCTWQGVMQDPLVCDFADCYVFSDTLQSMAALQGIGGLAPNSIIGDFGNGFLTKVGSESLDANYSGNVICHVAPCFPFLFGSHSMRVRDGVVWDTTFGSTYPHDDHGGVGTNLTWWDYETDTGQTCRPQDTESDGSIASCAAQQYTILRQVPSEYGNWFYSSLDRLPATAPPPDERTYSGALSLEGATFSPDPSSGGSSSGISAALTVTVDVDVKTPGTYFFHGALCQPGEKSPSLGGLCSGMEELISDQPSFATSERTIVSYAYLETGATTATLNFSGEDIFRRAQDGTWAARIIALDIDGKAVAPPATFDTPDYLIDQFGEMPVHTTEGSPHLLPGDVAGSPLLSMRFDLEVRIAGAYAFEMRLADRLKTVGYSPYISISQEDGSKTIPTRGYRSFEVGDYDAFAVFPLGDETSSDEYRVSLIVFGEDRTALAYFETAPFSLSCAEGEEPPCTLPSVVIPEEAEAEDAETD